MSKSKSGYFAGTLGDKAEKTPHSSSSNNVNQNENQNEESFSGFPKTIHAGKQGKYIPGHPNYVEGRSTLSISLSELQWLVLQYSGTGEKVSDYKERVDFGKIIGQFVKPNTGQHINTSKGIIHYAKDGVHVVHSDPNGGKITMINPNETPRFDAFYNYVYEHKDAIYTFLFPDGTEEKGVYFTSYETDNNLELDDPNYEEFWGIAFKDVITGKCFEITYHNLPEAVFCDGKRVI